MHALIPFIIILIILFLLRSAARDGKKTSSRGSAAPSKFRTAPSDNARWMETAGELHCRFNRPENGMPPSLSGSGSGTVFEVVPDSGADGLLYKVTFEKPLGIRLLIVRDAPAEMERMMRGRVLFPTSRFFGPSNFACSAENEDVLKHFLSLPEHRNVLIHLTGLHSRIMIADSGIVLKVGDKRFPEAETVRQLLRSAETLMLPVAAPVVKPASVPAPAAKPVHVAAPVMKPASVAAPVMKPASVPASAAKPVHVAAPVMSPASVPAPAVKPVHVAAPVVNPTPAPESVPASLETMPEPESFSNALFGSSSFPGPKEKAAFAAHAGTRVEWIAVLKTAYSFSTDFVFGNRPGVRASFELCTVGASGGIRHTVKGVVAFPPEALEMLRSKRDTAVRFRGTLLKFDGFSREIFLSDGELV